MTLAGTYYDTILNAKLVISKANDGNGQGAGTLYIGGHSVDLNLLYHFQNSVGPMTTLVVSGLKNDPNQYVGAVGSTNNSNYHAIQLAGGFATTSDVISFSGTFVRS